MLKSSAVSLNEYNSLQERIQILIEDVNSYKIDLQKQILNNEELQRNLDSVREREITLNRKLIDSSKEYEKIKTVLRKAATVIKNVILVRDISVTGYFEIVIWQPWMPEVTLMINECESFPRRIQA